MAEQERIADEESQADEQPEPDRGNGHQEEAASYEQELADYLQERIKPGLNRGAIPLLARSIAKEIAHGQHPQGGSEDGEADDEPGADDEPPSDFEADMHDLQAELGEDWILRFSVQGDDGWLTAEKDDGSQRVEAPTAAVLAEVVGLLNEGGGRPT